MKRLPRSFELPVIAALFLAGTVFLLRLAYLPIWVSMPIGMGYVSVVAWFARQQYDFRIPLLLPVLAVLAVGVDGFGNYFGWYQEHFSLLQYDEIAHTLIPALTAPMIIWLLREGIVRFGYRLPLGLITFFAMTTMFTISGFYEVIELWDDKYMHDQPGMRIHGAYDTPNDLQFDLIGVTLGAVLTYAVMKRRERIRTK